MILNWILKLRSWISHLILRVFFFFLSEKYYPLKLFDFLCHISKVFPRQTEAYKHLLSSSNIRSPSKHSIKISLSGCNRCCSLTRADPPLEEGRLMEKRVEIMSREKMGKAREGWWREVGWKVMKAEGGRRIAAEAEDGFTSFSFTCVDKQFKKYLKAQRDDGNIFFN